jgi:hypothetical protein
VLRSGSVTPAEAPTYRLDAGIAVIAFALAYADLGCFVNLLVAALLYGIYRLLRIRRNA